MTALVIAEHDNDSLSEASLSAVTAAGQLHQAIHVLVAGAGCRAAAEAAAAVPGVQTVLLADDPAYEHGLVEALAPLIAGLAADYDYLIAGATMAGKDLMPRVAGRLDTTQISDVTEILSPTTFIRPIYAGNAMAKVETAESKVILTVRPTSFAAAAAASGNGAIEPVDAGPAASKTRFVGRDLHQSERPDLATARVVIAGGRGLGSQENFQMLERIADKLNAAIGASRAAVDAGYAPNDMQVGQTGKVVAPDLYIAVGISGAIQHLAGMKDSKIIVAINKDEDAPIFEMADYGLVADLFEALPALEAELDKTPG